MTHLPSGRRNFIPVVIINRKPRKRATTFDGVACVIAGTFLLFTIAYLVTEVMR